MPRRSLLRSLAVKLTLDTAYKLGSTLPPSRIEAVAALLGSGAPNARIIAAVSSTDGKEALANFLEANETENITTQTAAAVLLSSSYTHQATMEEQRLELVVTGPSTPFVAARRTEQVVLDVISQAINDLFLVSFVARDWSRLIDEIVGADRRGVKIHALMEASKDSGGTLDSDQSKDLRSAVPNAKVYRWTDKDAEYIGGKVHAKIVLADQSAAFVTSANFTGHAMEKNFEAGLLVNGGQIPRDIKRHLFGLIEMKIISQT